MSSSATASMVDGALPSRSARASTASSPDGSEAPLTSRAGGGCDLPAGLGIPPMRSKIHEWAYHECKRA
jgi:hypothetical protein